MEVIVGEHKDLWRFEYWKWFFPSPALPTRSRIATLIVGRVTEPMMEAVSLPPKEVTNEFPSYLLR